jgi:CheY-like chemotaxis protein
MEETESREMSDPVQVVIVDDDATESESLAELLTASGDGLQASALRPSGQLQKTAKEVLERLPASVPRVLLLDYRLEEDVAKKDAVTYRGGTVADYLRDQDPELPIVLLTSEQKLHDWVETRPRMKQAFDWTLLKENLSNPDAAAEGAVKLIEFAGAWDQVRAWEGAADDVWALLGEVMAAPEGAIDQFRDLEADPPRVKVTGEVVRWLLYDALRTPGPLRGEDFVRVTLGLTRESFAKDQIAIWLEDAEYSGVLSAFHRRWWVHVVREQLSEACSGKRPLDSSGRARALADALSTQLESENCDWCGGERTIDACAICGNASDAAHCLRPLGPPIPAWAEPRIVCYRCISVGRAEENGYQFPPQSQEVVEGLKTGTISPPGNE